MYFTPWVGCSQTRTCGDAAFVGRTEDGRTGACTTLAHHSLDLDGFKLNAFKRVEAKGRNENENKRDPLLIPRICIA